ncbi:MAG: nucleobase:cation symporter, family [Actinomycetota bacterium]|nr:nucleobase:cation symporter, family [Actinomycetota bacterium]
MSTLLERPEFGIEPVPPEHRTLSALDIGVLWGDLGIGLLVLVTGALLVPGLGFWPAFAAIVVGSIIGVALLAAGASAGAQHGVPTMVLFRPILGIRGSWVPTVFNVAQLVGWTAVELWAISSAANFVSRRELGFESRGLWLGLAAIICTGLALWGPVGVTKQWLERFGVWVIGGISLAVTILVLTSGDLGTVLSKPGDGIFPSFGGALDLVIAMPVSWLPLVADYTRFGNKPRGAFFGTFWGYLLANVWLYSLGALLVLTADAAPSPEGIALGILTVGGGSIAGVLFLVGLLVGETDEAFANIYSGAVSIQNLWPRLSQKALIVGIAAIGTALAAILTMELYESFLFLIGSLFVPLFGVFLAEHFLIRRGRVATEELYKRSGDYWFEGGFRLRAFVPWIAGFVVYHVISPSPVDWWMDLFSVFGDPLSQDYGWLSASIPSFVIAFVVSLAMGRDISSRRLPREVNP